LIETGVRFLESLAAVARSVPAGDGSPGLASLVSHDPRTNAPVLSIPLPQSVDQDRVLRAIAALMAAFGRSAYLSLFAAG
jgi:hypothetical protein